MPPTLNLDDPDAAAGALDLTPHEARRRELRIALVNAFGFGGQNSAVVLRSLGGPMTERRDVAGLIASIDGLEALLERAGLSELEVEAGGHDDHPARHPPRSAPSIAAPGPRQPQARIPRQRAPVAATGDRRQRTRRPPRMSSRRR